MSASPSDIDGTQARIERANHEARERRNEVLRRLRAGGATISDLARQFGLDRATVRYAVNPEHTELRKEQMRFRYYLNTVMPREMGAE